LAALHIRQADVRPFFCLFLFFIRVRVRAAEASALLHARTPIRLFLSLLWSLSLSLFAAGCRRLLPLPPSLPLLLPPLLRRCRPDRIRHRAADVTTPPHPDTLASL
jgi:hypothetical protein